MAASSKKTARKNTGRIKGETLFIIDKNSLKDVETSDDIKVDIVKITKGTSALKLTCGGRNQAPRITLHDTSNPWKLSRFHYLAFDVTNPGKKDLVVEIRMNEVPWGATGTVIPSGKTRTCRANIGQKLPEYYEKKIIGMYLLPDGISKGENADSVHLLALVIPCPLKGTTVYISNISGEGKVTFPSEKEVAGKFFPLVDQFGQYRHTDWPEKIHTLKELKQYIATEDKDIKKHPGPSGWDKYGGWLKGPQLKATGHFRTEKVKGKWWLVDPDGHLFWSHGMGCVRPGDGSTTITDREFYFSALPDASKYAQFYSSRGWSAPFGYYKGRATTSFNQTAWNLYKKYGDTWKKKADENIPRRIRSWGLNSLGAWSSPEIFLKSIVPYAPIISSGSRKLEGSEGHWTKFPDPYDAGFAESLIKGITAIEKSITDPYCIGYFVNNELTYGDPTGIGRWTIASPADQPAKIVMADFLKKRYPDINQLNASWGTKFSSWDDLLKNTQSLDIRNKDTEDFTVMAINEYFKRIRDTLKKLAPDKLFLGSRLDFHWYPSETNLNEWDARTGWIVNIAAQYCDVVSFNRYRSTAEDVRPGNCDKPVIIGEWHHTTLEKSTFYRGPEHFTENLKSRAQKYDYFVKSCMNNPHIVGAHYFQYYDQPTVGRADGENFSCGFVAICDRPHDDMIAVSRKTGKSMYTMRLSGG
jgi:hypothetical protein